MMICLYKEDLLSELSSLHTLYHSAERDEVPSVNSIKTALLTLSINQQMLIITACHLFQLLPILPTANATPERPFSALQHIKSYLRSTMSQPKLNHLMILHYHQDMTDNLDLKSITIEHITKKMKWEEEHLLHFKYFPCMILSKIILSAMILYTYLHVVVYCILA